MHVAQLGLIQRHAHTGQVNRLATGHAGRAGGMRQQAAQGGLHAGCNGLACGGQQLEGQRLQRVAGQQGAGFAKLHMHGRLAAPQHIVVHAGHVVVHQRIGMDQFRRAGCAQCRLVQCCTAPRAIGGGHGVAGGQHQQRAQPLAAVQHGIAHRFAQAGRRIGAHPERQCALDPPQLRTAPEVQVKHTGARGRTRGQRAHSCAAHGCSVPFSST